MKVIIDFTGSGEKRAAAFVRRYEVAFLRDKNNLGACLDAILEKISTNGHYEVSSAESVDGCPHYITAGELGEDAFIYQDCDID